MKKKKKVRKLKIDDINSFFFDKLLLQIKKRYEEENDLYKESKEEK